MKMIELNACLYVTEALDADDKPEAVKEEDEDGDEPEQEIAEAAPEPETAVEGK